MYFKSIIIYMAIILAEMYLFKDNIAANGWTSNRPKPITAIEAFALLVCMSAIPLIRFMFAICILAMAMYTPEQIEEWSKDE